MFMAQEHHRRMRRAERRMQILAAATTAFARGGYAATSLDDVASEAGISKVILYRHFDSKHDLYHAVLDRACERLAERVGEDNFTEDTIPAMVRAAMADPDGFRLLFRYAAREPAVRDQMERFTAAAVDVARRNIEEEVPDPAWREWAARLLPQLTTESLAVWLDVGQPDPDQAAERLRQLISGVFAAALPRTHS